MKSKPRIALLAFVIAFVVAACPALAFADLQVGAFEGDGLASEPDAPLTTQSASVSNPRVVEDSSMQAGQRATWDCVWFGSYPQTEVTSSDSAYSSMQSASWDANGDATVDGAKYKRVSKGDTTDSSKWPSSAGTYRYFRYEPIKWRVLSVSGSTAFALADIALDCQRYNANYVSVSWKTCSIRSWLNGYGASYNQPGVNFMSKNFIGAAFSPGEQSAIVPTKEVCDDKVLLLSYSEVAGDTAPTLGFTSGRYMENGRSGMYEDRMCKASDFADAMGGLRFDDYTYWCLRQGLTTSSGYYPSCTLCNIAPTGRVYDNVGTGPVNGIYAVRPAMNLDLSSSYVTPAGTVSSNGDVAQFADAPRTHWVASEGWLDYVTGKGLMSGYAGTVMFGPDDPLTRGQVATILFRYANPGSNATTDASAYATNATQFRDNASGQYYTAAMNWAYDQCIFTGDKDGNGNPKNTVRPGDGITRQELATVLFRFAEVRGASAAGASAASYAKAPDASSVAAWAAEGMGWCFANGVMTGDSATKRLNPGGGATRAHMAKMITVVTRDVLG